MTIISFEKKITITICSTRMFEGLDELNLIKKKMKFINGKIGKLEIESNSFDMYSFLGKKRGRKKAKE